MSLLLLSCAAALRRYGRLLVAANLRDSEALMPHLILQLIALLAHCPLHTVLLSVYESGSRDATGENARGAYCSHWSCRLPCTASLGQLQAAKQCKLAT